MTDDLNLETRIALQNEIWSRFKIAVPTLEAYLARYLKHENQKLPQHVSEVEAFIANGFGAYLEPIPGMVCSRDYSKREFEAAGIRLVERRPGLDGWYHDYQDETHGLWWTDVEGRYGELVGTVFRLIGKDRS